MNPEQYRHFTIDPDLVESHNRSARLVFDSIDVRSPTDFYNETGVSEEIMRLFGSFAFTLHSYIELCRKEFGVTGDIMQDLSMCRERVAELIKQNVHGISPDQGEVKNTDAEFYPKDLTEIRDVEDGVYIDSPEGPIYKRQSISSFRSVESRSEGTPWSNIPKKKKTPRGWGRAAKKKGIL